MATTWILELYHIMWYFLVYSFLGWGCEVIFCSVDTGKFVNRGFLNGPVCPIYGFGAVIIVTALAPLSGNLPVLFLVSVVLCSLLELAAGFLLKTIFHTSWWDYSDQPFNLGGYICLKFSLLWGLGCLLLVHVIHPGVKALVAGIPAMLGWALLSFFYAILLVDLALTVAVITKLNRDLREITRLSEKLRRPSDALAKTLGNSAISVADRLEDSEAAASFKEAALVVKDSALEMNARLEKLLRRRTRMRDRLLSAFPKMKSAPYREALEKLREYLDKSQSPNKHDPQN